MTELSTLLFIALLASGGVGLIMLSEALLIEGVLKLLGWLLGIGIVIASLVWFLQWLLDGGYIS